MTDTNKKRSKSSVSRQTSRKLSKPTLPTFEHENIGREAGFRLIAGIDEAGRGPWAGPVVAAAVILDPDNTPDGIADSKKLSEAQREAVFEELIKEAHVGIAFADAERIDRDNILAATMWSMQQAVGELGIEPDLVLVDGNRAPELGCKTETIVKGDALSLSIAAASIAAKVSRDRMMRRLDIRYPQYGFAQHKGYGTAMHRAALEEYGATPMHRRSFQPVREVIKQREKSGIRAA